MKKFLTNENIKVLWKLFNEFCGLALAILIFLNTNDVLWAGGAYVIATRISEMSTRWFNKIFLQNIEEKEDRPVL